MNNQNIPTEKRYSLLIFMIGFVLVVIGITLLFVLLSIASTVEQMMTFVGIFLLLLAVAYAVFRYIVHRQ